MVCTGQDKPRDSVNARDLAELDGGADQLAGESVSFG
jgi:hypothetical protein